MTTTAAHLIFEATRTLVRGRSRAAALCVSYVDLCSYVLRVSGEHTPQLLFFCPFVLMFSALAANK